MSAVPEINQDVKFVTMFPKHTSLNHSLPSVYLNLNCAPKNIVYLFSYNTGHKQYTGITEKFLSRFINCRCAYRKFFKNKKIK